MIDPAEVQLDREVAPTPGSPSSRVSPKWVLTGLAVVIGLGSLWFVFGGRQEQPVPGQQAEAPTPRPLMTTHAPGSICQATDLIALPALSDSDTFAGTLATTLSSNPRITAWLTPDNLIRRFVVVVDLIATGKNPSAQLGPLRPSGTFRVEGTEGAFFIDPRNDERYAAVADAIDSVDVEASARVCSALKPRLDDAYAELGGLGSFDDALERAIVSILQTPHIGPETRLVSQGAIFRFEDPSLERLTPTQKHLIRMGTRHGRVVRDKLRQIALAIGIPPERLPS